MEGLIWPPWDWWVTWPYKREPGAPNEPPPTQGEMARDGEVATISGAGPTLR